MEGCIMSSLRFPIIAGLLLLSTSPMRAQADLVTGTFTGTVLNNSSDPANLTSLGDDLSEDDSLTGSFSFDTSAISGGAGTNTLVINIADTTSGQSTTYYDGGTDGYYGDGSFFQPVSGAYSLYSSSGSDDSGEYLSQFVELNLISPAIQDGVYGQSFTVGSGSGSTGQIDGDFFDGDLDGYINFSIDSASMTDASLPEPAGLAMFGCGLLGLTLMRRRTGSRLRGRREPAS
jgi:hypothetical protein